jgi:isomerase DpgB
METRKLSNNATQMKLIIRLDLITISECIQQVQAFCDEVESSSENIIMSLEVYTANDSWLPSQIKEMSQLYPKWEKCMARLEKIKNMKIVCCPNNVSQMALELLMVADYRIVGQKSDLKLVSAQLGVVPTTALYRATKLLGAQLAKRIFLFGQTLDASEGVNFGLYDECTEDIETAERRLLGSMTKGVLNDFSVRRRLIEDSHNLNIHEALGAHLAACDRLFASSSEVNTDVNR